MCACFSAVKLLVLSFTATPQRCSSHCRGVWYRSSWTGWWTTSERPTHSEMSDLGSSPLAIAPCTAQQTMGMTAPKTAPSSEQGNAPLSFLSSCLFYSVVAFCFLGVGKVGGGACVLFFCLSLINFSSASFSLASFFVVQFSSGWYLCARKSSAVVLLRSLTKVQSSLRSFPSSAVVLLRSLKSPALSQKFPKLCCSLTQVTEKSTPLSEVSQGCL